MIEYAIVIGLMCFCCMKCFVWNAICISLSVVQSLGHILFETALTCGLRRVGRLRPHPSLRDYGLRFSQDTRLQRVGTDDFYRLS